MRAAAQTLVPAVVEQSAARSGGGPLEPRLSGLYLLPLRVMSERICCSRPRTKLRAYARLAARRPSLGRWPWALGCCWPARRPRRHQLLRDQRCITTSESAQRKSAWGSHEVTVMVDVSRLSQCEAAAPTRFWRSILRHRSHPPHRSPRPMWNDSHVACCAIAALHDLSPAYPLCRLPPPLLSI